MKKTQVARLLAYVTGMVNQQLLVQHEYLVAENRILRSHLPARLRLTDPQRGATTFTNNLTILGGTGTFSGATRFATAIGMTIASSGNPAPGYFGTVATSGTGQITASGLTAVPEPTTYALFGLGLGAAIFAKRRRLI